MGILHCKILCALIMMGPDWHLKRVFDRVNVFVPANRVCIITKSVFFEDLSRRISRIKRSIHLRGNGFTYSNDYRFNYRCTVRFGAQHFPVVW